MSKLQLLRVFLNERLTAAAVEIFGAFEKTVAEYQEENERLRRLLQITPDIRCGKDSVHFSLSISGEAGPSEQQHNRQNNGFSNHFAVRSDPGLDNRSTLEPNPPMGEHYYQPNTTTSRTHRCSDCGETFALKDDLQRHQLQTLNGSGIQASTNSLKRCTPHLVLVL
ncbi:hypothetical protein UPYG_G00067360 [Umbra pygmaea]|uniref:C2H2-type domain-containing protein n=1 Tax=Umbra pygmaea TaxID=75934 RepID=A0ABD0XAR2_UMBPY